MRRTTKECKSVDQPITILSHNPRNLPPQTTYQKQRLLRGGPKAAICKLRRTNVEFPMRTFIQNFFAFYIKPLHLRETCSRGRTWNGQLHYELRPLEEDVLKFLVNNHNSIPISTAEMVAVRLGIPTYIMQCRVV